MVWATQSAPACYLCSQHHLILSTMRSIVPSDTGLVAHGTIKRIRFGVAIAARIALTFQGHTRGG
jgi:hypothetical protein